MSFRRHLFRRARFDENLTGWATMEDVDMVRQLLALDKRILYVPSARQAHYPSPAGRLNQPAISEMSVRNHYYLFTKHHSGSTLEKAAFIWSLIGLGLAALWRGGFKGYIRAMRNVVAGVSIRYEKPSEFSRGVLENEMNRKSAVNG